MVEYIIVKWKKKGGRRAILLDRKRKRRNCIFYDEDELSSSSLKLNWKFECILFDCLRILEGIDGGGMDCINARFCC